MASQNTNKLRVLLDANVLVAGMGWPRFPYEVLRHAAKGDFQLVLSPFVIDEARTHILKLLPNMIEKFDAFLEESKYEEISSPSVEELSEYSVLARDIKDIPVALAAIQAEVDFLITQDKDLTEADEPVHEYLKVLLPGTFLRQYLNWTSEALEAIRKRTWDELG
jgi:predicted nucleic acid-binding protein